jgi:hypothetical protein
VPVVFYIVALVIGGTGVATIISAVRNQRHRRRPDLAERLLPYQPSALADEVHHWLRHRLTRRLPPDRPGQWLTVPVAAARLGISPDGLRGIAKREGRPGVLASELDAMRVRIQIPGR